MSQYLKKLQPMETLSMKGPRGRFEYKRNMKNHIGTRAYAQITLIRPDSM